MITVVASLGSNRVIGRDGDLAWRDPADLQRVRAMTMGHTLIMGRRTFDSIGHPLPGRKTIVVTRQPGWTSPGVERAASLSEAVAAARLHDRQVFVFGGGEVYAQAMAVADALELTDVHRVLDGDVLFPVVDPQHWRETAREARDGYDWVSYLRS